jgi:hypothetical protein
MSLRNFNQKSKREQSKNSSIECIKEAKSNNQGKQKLIREGYISRPNATLEISQTYYGTNEDSSFANKRRNEQNSSEKQRFTK